MFIYPQHAGVFEREVNFLNRMILKVIVAILQVVAILLALLL